MHKHLKIAAYIAVGTFALIGFVFVAVFIGMQFGAFNVRGSTAERNAFFAGAAETQKSDPKPNQNPNPLNPPYQGDLNARYDWNITLEWQTIAAGLTKDKAVIERVSRETGVPARLIAAVAVPEQMRFFTAERELFKRVFEPLKILGSLSQFSLGVSGIKQETANKIEQYASDESSPFYTGTSTAALLAYPQGSGSHDAALYARLTDEHNHYYSYLYTAVYILEIEQQWRAAGIDISGRPDIIATLFNIGFAHSVPNASPEVGGATITVGGQPYAYGELAGLFYDSGELTDVFARE